MMSSKKKTRWIVLAMTIGLMLTLTGCKDEQPFMLDGPGMEYHSPWTEFTVTRSGSNTQYNFWFTVVDNGDQALVTGECSDDKGHSYFEEVGIAISAEDLWQLRWMDFHLLDEPTEWPEDMELPTDMTDITLKITLTDGTVEEKNASSELSMEICNLLLPYLKNN